MTFVFAICYFILSGAILCGMARLTLGPSTLDRILAFDTMTISVIGVIILFSIQQQSLLFLEIILIFCLLGFTSTIAFTNYLFKIHLKDKDSYDDE